MSQIDLTIVILSWNTRELTCACLAALARDPTKLTREIVVVDNGSVDGSADAIAEAYPDVILIRNPENRYYAAANNQGVRAGSGRWLCTLNSDTEVTPGTLDSLVEFVASNPEYGAASPKLVSSGGQALRSCCRIPGLLEPLLESTPLGLLPPFSWWWAHKTMQYFDHLESRDVDQPPGACMVMDRDEFLELGGLDPELALFFNDVDFCKRLAARGRRIRYMADLSVLHHHGSSTSVLPERATLWTRNRMSYYRKHHGRLAVAYLYGLLFFEAARIWLAVKLGRRSPEEKRSALDELRTYVNGSIGRSS